MTLLEAVHSETGTFHSFAAACTSIMRAAAPPLRTYSFDWRAAPPAPGGKTAPARARVRRADAGAAAGGELAPGALARDALARGRILDLDLVPVAVELLGDEL